MDIASLFKHLFIILKLSYMILLWLSEKHKSKVTLYRDQKEKKYSKAYPDRPKWEEINKKWNMSRPSSRKVIIKYWYIHRADDVFRVSRKVKPICIETNPEKWLNYFQNPHLMQYALIEKGKYKSNPSKVFTVRCSGYSDKETSKKARLI